MWRQKPSRGPPSRVAYGVREPLTLNPRRSPRRRRAQRPAPSAALRWGGRLPRC